MVRPPRDGVTATGQAEKGLVVTASAIRSVAIVGAGLAGLVAARRLHDAGVSCVLFDKSRGLGGRMATRRVGELQFDHGAQYLRAAGPGFRAALEEWRAAGRVLPWFEDAYVGLPGMSGLARGLLGDIGFVPSALVTRLARGPSGWTLCGADGPIAAAGNGAFDAVILALPAPQAAPILASAGVAFAELARASYAPCWALMLSFGARVPLARDRLRFDDGAIAWIARDSSKPGRLPDNENFVVHASAEWSRQRLEDSADAVGRTLLQRFCTATGAGGAPTFIAAHRWRYALVEQAADVPCLWDAAAGVGACGDWCLGPRLESAFESGAAMAAAVMAA